MHLRKVVVQVEPAHLSDFLGRPRNLQALIIGKFCLKNCQSCSCFKHSPLSATQLLVDIAVANAPPEVGFAASSKPLPAGLSALGSKGVGAPTARPSWRRRRDEVCFLANMMEAREKANNRGGVNDLA